MTTANEILERSPAVAYGQLSEMPSPPRPPLARLRAARYGGGQRLIDELGFCRGQVRIDLAVVDAQRHAGAPGPADEDYNQVL